VSPVFHYKWPRGHPQDIPNVQVVTENLFQIKGSCCGTIEYSVNTSLCVRGGWWYQCRDYGLRNFTTWLKFGEYGFTMPPVTPHLRACEYHSNPVKQCPVPTDCDFPIPRKASFGEILRGNDVCDPLVRTEHLGPLDSYINQKDQEKQASSTQEDGIRLFGDVADRFQTLPDSGKI
jgi:hypothetical protein